MFCSFFLHFNSTEKRYLFSSQQPVCTYQFVWFDLLHAFVKGLQGYYCSLYSEWMWNIWSFFIDLLKSILFHSDNLRWRWWNSNCFQMFIILWFQEPHSLWKGQNWCVQSKNSQCWASEEDKVWHTLSLVLCFLSFFLFSNCWIFFGALFNTTGFLLEYANCLDQDWTWQHRPELQLVPGQSGGDGCD